MLLWDMSVSSTIRTDWHIRSGLFANIQSMADVHTLLEVSVESLVCDPMGQVFRAVNSNYNPIVGIAFQSVGIVILWEYHPWVAA
jgi:hypothetical protein